MKNYKQLIKELPSKSVVFAFGRFNPPTIGHELLVRAVRKLAQQRKADHVIYASASHDAKKNPLDVSKKVGYLRQMFPNTNFVAAGGDERTFIEAAKALNKRYKNIIMIAGSDRVPAFKKLLNDYNGKEYHYDTIEVVSAGERDPDADDATGMSASKMRALAVKGDYLQFKRGLPTTIRDIDGRRLMNDIRQGMGLDVVKEQLNLVKDQLREKYFRGEVYKLGDIVESAGEVYKIIKRGSNHLLLQDQIGARVTKWIQDVSETEKAFMVNEDLTDKTLKVSTDKIKVARIIATMMGIDNAEAMANPEQLVNQALRKARQKALNPEALNIIAKMLSLASEVGIKYDENLKPQKLKEDVAATAASAKTAQRQSRMADLQAKQAKQKEDLAKQQKKEFDQLRDQMKISEESKDDGLVHTDSKYNIAKSIMRYSDFRKMTNITPKDETAVEDPNKETESDHDASIGDTSVPTSYSGHTIEPTGDHNLRRRKVNYHLGESYDDNRTGFAKKPREDDEGHPASSRKTFRKDFYKDRPHTVHVDGKKWKTFDNGYQAHKAAETLRAKGKTANVIGHYKEQVELDESHVEFRLDHRDTVKGDHKPTFADHEAKVSDTTDKATYVKVPSHKADSFKRAMKTKHGVTAELAESTTPYYQKASWQKKMADAAKRERLAREKKEKEAQQVKEETVEQSIDREEQVKRFKDQAKDAKLTGDVKKEEYCADEYGSGEIDINSGEIHDAMTDKEIDHVLDELTDEDFLEVYDDEELAIVDAETGEETAEVEDERGINEDSLNEVLSRMERMRSRMRIRTTKSKRVRAEKIALKRYSDMKTINKRARRMAIKLIKQRMLRGRNLKNISVPEKERLERFIEKRKAIITRIAGKLSGRIRKMEKNRLSHSNFTTGSSPSVF